MAYQLAGSGQVDELVVVDKDPSRALATASKAGARGVELDIEEGGELRTLLEGATVVFNAVGPYHQHGLKVIDAAIGACVHYVDMNDDHEVTEAIFLDPTWDLRARESGTTILSGCGIMPGLSRILARYGYDKLDRPERVSIWFVWNYSLAYPTAIHHFLRINSGLGPQYIHGDTVKP
ncbi:MAG: saccharopine dehydrogenase NADP-binding domain-containing protein, partial [Chloroflexi bacterium]|nr:saccharopine dehydrogenase NADP-binding domain-containing protein [Chloroflexota bacterium]